MQEVEKNGFDRDEPQRRSWAEWFGSDDAIRMVFLLFGLAIIAIIMGRLQFSTPAVCCGDWDGYYHIRWSQLLWENFSQGKWLPEFKWLPLTVLNPQDYADHHFLFHLLQIPFLWFFEPVMAAKVAAVIFGSLAIFSVYLMMYRYRVNHLLLWLGALLTCANPFFYRMNMAKAPPLTIIYTVLGIYLLFQRKYIWLMPLMFVFVWTYSLFPMLLIAALIWTVIIAWNEKKVEWRPATYTFAGMVLGNLINPYFPHNLGLFFEHFITKFKSGDFTVGVGGEWYPYTGWELITHLTIAMLAMLLGYILFGPKEGKLPEKATFFLMFATVLFFAMFRSKRYAEYFPPFAVLFAAFSWQAFWAAPVVELPEDFRRDLEPFLDVEVKAAKKDPLGVPKQVAAILIGVFFLGLMYYNFIGIDLERWGLKDVKQEGMITSISNNEKADKHRRAMEWVKNNIPEGELIFNADWDDFPKMFFYDQKHAYVSGLDPTYLYSKNPDLSRLFDDITNGKHDDPALIIREKFGSHYIFSDIKRHPDMYAKAMESGWVEKIYEDDEDYVLRIRDEKGEPPKEAAGADNDSEPTPDEIKAAEDEENDNNLAEPDDNVPEDNKNDQ
ncbi:MAG TPA: hypothetical protein VGO50_04405 [Pyrinomonadaceae bacterium]|jgi:hypothetical protein|nr:hypothetical protein [Pyrinomonadaceae bacterium]